MLESAAPLFLIGAPRSGTTILSKLMNSHPKIVLTNETAVFLQLHEMIEKSRIGVRSGILYGKAYHRDWAALLEERAPSLIEEFYERVAVLEGKTELAFWGEKHPHLNNCLPLLATLYPEARYIYAIRDPRDSACSIAEMNGVPVRKALDTWSRFTQGYEKFVAELPAGGYSLVRYEDMVQDYQGTLTRLLAELGLQLDEQVLNFLEQNKNRDSHQGGINTSKQIDFLDKSYMRWKRDMNEEDRAYAQQICGEPMRKYGYSASGVGPLPAETLAAAIPPKQPANQLPEILDFHCNICGSENRMPVADLDRERRSCKSCGSSVRTRSIVHLLSTALYGRSCLLSDFTADRDIRGIGLSDWAGYATVLQEKFSYQNTYFHKRPRFDVTNPGSSGFLELDFLIATEVFEHVVPPARKAFDGAYAALKTGGWLILTVPYMNRLPDTIEHFPELHEYEIRKDAEDRFVLTNTTTDGRYQTFTDLRFHGGPGETLEMRIFSRDALLRHLTEAGFTDVRIMSDDYPEYGIVWNTGFSLPILARK